MVLGIVKFVRSKCLGSPPAMWLVAVTDLDTQSIVTYVRPVSDSSHDPSTPSKHRHIMHSTVFARTPKTINSSRYPAYSNRGIYYTDRVPYVGLILIVWKRTFLDHVRFDSWNQDTTPSLFCNHLPNTYLTISGIYLSYGKWTVRPRTAWYGKFSPARISFVLYLCVHVLNAFLYIRIRVLFRVYTERCTLSCARWCYSVHALHSITVRLSIDVI